MGSAYTTIAVDTAARFQRLTGRNVTFVTGTDEHGEKIAAAAAANGLSPQEHCDNVAAQFRELWQQVCPLAANMACRLGHAFPRAMALWSATVRISVMQMDIRYDAWIRTTDADHERLVCQFLQRVKDAGDVYKDTYEGWYCVGCEKYLDEEEMDERKACRTHRTPCSQRREENHFFRLSRQASPCWAVYKVSTDCALLSTLLLSQWCQLDAWLLLPAVP